MMNKTGWAVSQISRQPVVPFMCLILASALALGGCSSGSWFSRDGAKSASAKNGKAKKEPEMPEVKKVRRGDKRAYPNLSTVPKRPNVTSQERRLVIEEGLLADRAKARHTDATPVWARPKTVDAGATGQTATAPKVETVTVAGTRLATIRFPVGSARLPPGAAGLMRQIAAIQRRSGSKVIAVGHTTRRRRSKDLDKDKGAKQALALARASAVTSMLARMGVSRNRLESISRGDAEPANPGRPFLNRRVDIFMRR